MKYSLSLILLILFFCSYGQQHPAVSQPGYNPTVPRLISMQHKAVSHSFTQLKPTIDDFNNKVNTEDVNVYMVYTKDSTVGATYTANHSELFFPPQKLMDFYLIYDYRFKFFVESKEMIRGIIPKIYLSGGYIAEVKAINYYKDGNGKLKDRKVKKSALNITTADGFFTLDPDISLIEDNSLIDLSIQVKSRYFTKIAPTITDNKSFAKSLTLSYPSIFKYTIPDKNNYELVSTSSSEFQLLHFRRNTGPGNGNIDIVKTDATILNIKFISGSEPDIEFNMDGLTIPSQYDIGILSTDIIKIL